MPILLRKVVPFACWYLAVSQGDLHKRLFLDSLTVDLMEDWRRVQLPLTAIFAALVTVHVVSILVLWKW
jgi:hypothetical protein